MCPVSARASQPQAVAVVDNLKPDPILMDVLLAALTGSPPAGHYPRFIRGLVEWC